MKHTLQHGPVYVLYLVTLTENTVDHAETNGTLTAYIYCTVYSKIMC